MTELGVLLGNLVRPFHHSCHSVSDVHFINNKVLSICDAIGSFQTIKATRMMTHHLMLLLKQAQKARILKEN